MAKNGSFSASGHLGFLPTSLWGSSYTASHNVELPQSCYHYFLNLRTIKKGILRLNYTIQGKFSTGIFVGAARRLGSLD